MASDETGECCVCGKETANRCGACAEADFSLFFCSREHQKVIWPVHKRVCGPGKCSPFRWPRPNEDEAADARAHAHDKGVEGQSLEDYLARVCGLKTGEGLFALELIMTDALTDVPSIESATLARFWVCEGVRCSIALGGVLPPNPLQVLGMLTSAGLHDLAEEVRDALQTFSTFSLSTRP
ncbi:hypothetical protein JCM10213_004142 [Rhodosporidiobolus nylandii]